MQQTIDFSDYSVKPVISSSFEKVKILQMSSEGTCLARSDGEEERKKNIDKNAGQ